MSEVKVRLRRHTVWYNWIFRHICLHYVTVGGKVVRHLCLLVTSYLVQVIITAAMFVYIT